MPQKLMSRRTAAVLSTVALVAGGTMMMAPVASAATRISLTIIGGPTVDADSVTISYEVNRQSKAVRSQSCSLNDSTTTTPVACGTLISSPKTNPATYAVTLNNLENGTYTYTVSVFLTRSSGSATLTSTPFTIDVIIDTDGDGVPDSSDNCPTIQNSGQSNWDGDAAGNDCDPFPLDWRNEINCDDFDPMTQDIYNPYERTCSHSTWDPITYPFLDDNDPRTIDTVDPITGQYSHTRVAPDEAYLKP